MSDFKKTKPDFFIPPSAKSKKKQGMTMHFQHRKHRELTPDTPIILSLREELETRQKNYSRSIIPKEQLSLPF